MTARKRVLIIGLDGFTWTLGGSLMDDGLMPNLAKLVAKGCHGNLQSVMPYETAPAWVSFQTGCCPGKTGVFAFHTYDRNLKKVRLSSFSDVAVPSLWELADRAGKKVVSINMPVSSPPPKVNGVIIPGLLCPELSPRTCHPPEAYERYIKPHKDYFIMIKRERETVAQVVEQNRTTEQTRFEVALEIMNDIDWDIFSFQLQSTDALQHQLWNLVSPTNKQSSSDKTTALSFYSFCDDLVGKLITAAGDDVLTVIVSDHGFCDGLDSVGLNVWLRQKGYLNLIKKPRTRWDAVKGSLPLLKIIAQTYGHFKKMLPTVPPPVQPRPILKGAKDATPDFYVENQLIHLRRILDLNSTEAFCLGGMGGLLYINATGDRKAQLQKKLTAELLEEFGPDSSNRAIESIRTASEVYGNEIVENFAPDLVIKYLPGYESRIGPLGNSVIIKKNLEGTHSPQGIFTVNGAGVSESLKFDAEIIDICPTILAYMGIPVGHHIDGKVLENVFTQPLNVRYEDTATGGKASVEYSDDDQAEVEKHLTDLGYM